MNGLWYAFLISIFQVSLLAWCPCTWERLLLKTWEASWGSCPAFSFALGFSQLKSWACMNFWGRYNSELNFSNLFNIIQLHFHTSYEIELNICVSICAFLIDRRSTGHCFFLLLLSLPLSSWCCYRGFQKVHATCWLRSTMFMPLSLVRKMILSKNLKYFRYISKDESLYWWRNPIQPSNLPWIFKNKTVYAIDMLYFCLDFP